MIRLRYTPDTEDGGTADKLGREMLAETIRIRAMELATGEPVAKKSWVDDRNYSLQQMADMCRWASDAAWGVSGMMASDPTQLFPESGMTQEQWFGWTLAHQYLCGLYPSQPGGVSVCCESCLVRLVGALYSQAAYTMVEWLNGDFAFAQQYLLEGSPLPHNQRGAYLT